MLDYLACIQIISIHALREEGDATCWIIWPASR